METMGTWGSSPSTAKHCHVHLHLHLHLHLHTSPAVGQRNSSAASSAVPGPFVPHPRPGGLGIELFSLPRPADSRLPLLSLAAPSSTIDHTLPCSWLHTYSSRLLHLSVSASCLPELQAGPAIRTFAVLTVSRNRGCPLELRVVSTVQLQS